MEKVLHGNILPFSRCDLSKLFSSLSKTKSKKAKTEFLLDWGGELRNNPVPTNIVSRRSKVPKPSP